MHVAIAGNIGSGKTTLTTLLAKHYNWLSHFEDADDNPFINDFYDDMQRWSFNMQVYYLQNRFSKVLDLRKNKKTVIQDRTIYEDAYIFAPNLHSMGLMTTRDFESYLALFKLLESLISPPDVLVYLRASVSTLVNNIQKRGRDYETSIRIDYLKRLNERYEAWITDYEEQYRKKSKLLIIDIDENNFSEKKEHLGEVVRKIDGVINGLF